MKRNFLKTCLLAAATSSSGLYRGPCPDMARRHLDADQVVGALDDGRTWSYFTEKAKTDLQYADDDI